jgi:hypothetical protein
MLYQNEKFQESFSLIKVIWWYVDLSTFREFSAEDGLKNKNQWLRLLNMVAK